MRFLRRGILSLLVSFTVSLGTVTLAAAQCAYPALELLEFGYVNRPRVAHKGTDGQTARNVCLTASIQEAGHRKETLSRIQYEYEGRILVLHTLLRWLNLDAVAEAWTPLPSN